MIVSSFTTVYLVRHGETLWNREKRLQGALDSPLTALGQAQAAALGNALGAARVSRLCTSDLERALSTARAIGAVVKRPLRVDPRLRERNYGMFQGLTWTEIEAQHPEAYARLQARDPQFLPPGGETLVDFGERVIAVLTEIAESAAGERVAVIAHGGVVGIMYRHVQSIPLDARRDYSLLNASINRFRFAAGAWHMEAWGDVSHLQSLDTGEPVGEGPQTFGLSHDE